NLNNFLATPLNKIQETWVENNALQAEELISFLESNSNSVEAQTATFNIFDIILNENITDNERLNQIINIIEQIDNSINSSNIIDYSTEILRLENWIKTHGNIPFGDYIQSLVLDLNNMTLGEVQDIYVLVKYQKARLQGLLMLAIISPVIEAIAPFIEFAIIDASLGAAIPLISKIPLSFVTRGVKLEAMILETTQLGIQGNNQFVRMVHAQNSATKAESLFSTLTKDAIFTPQTITTPLGQLIKADMGNGNFIVLRYFSATNPSAYAVVEYNFQQILSTNSFEIKFLP
ncbi:MAG: hypothetical protein V3U80_08350, partial [Flavobacteriaceae bacterium]